MDRNTQRRDFKRLGLLSLSARRAWIEMHCVEEVSGDTWVALRKESVDRNEPIGEITLDGLKPLSARRAWIEIIIISHGSALPMSLSARRAWIEILYALDNTPIKAVALRKESVDRNDFPVVPVELTTRRSPQGERG